MEKNKFPETQIAICKVLKGDERKDFELAKIKIDVLKSNLIRN